MKHFTHFSEGEAKMVDIGSKPNTHRIAIARAIIKVSEQTIKLLQTNKLAKGDAITISKIAGIQAAKKTSDIIPLCHPLALENIEINVEVIAQYAQIRIQTKVQSYGKTGVEMESLFALSATCLTLYDMCKSADKQIIIEKQGLYKKFGGKSGNFVNQQLTW